MKNTLFKVILIYIAIICIYFLSSIYSMILWEKGDLTFLNAILLYSIFALFQSCYVFLIFFITEKILKITYIKKEIFFLTLWITWIYFIFVELSNIDNLIIYTFSYFFIFLHWMFVKFLNVNKW